MYWKETIVERSKKNGSRQAEAMRSSKEGEAARRSAVQDEENRGGPGGTVIRRRRPFTSFCLPGLRVGPMLLLNNVKINTAEMSTD